MCNTTLIIRNQGDKDCMRLLIAQSSKNILKIIKNNLLPEGFDLDFTADGESTLWHANEGNYSAIIIDILLPEINGKNVCQNIRDKGIHTPIMVLTTKCTLDDEIGSLEAGADDFLRIPFDGNLFVARIKALVRRRRNRRIKSEITFGLFCYDAKNRKIIFDKHEISLTYREGKVFEMLMLAEGEIVSKQTLIDHVWGLDFAGDPNIVDVYIGYLRRKVYDKNNNGFVKNIRGVGYCLTA